MKIGFTGTREGMTDPQKFSFRQLLITLSATELHHGDCIGADAEAHAIARELGLRIVKHPPRDPTHQAHCRADETRAPQTHFARNRDIVDETDHLIGASVADYPLSKGGTWYTINYAVKKNLNPYVIWPLGTVSVIPIGYKT